MVNKFLKERIPEGWEGKIFDKKRPVSQGGYLYMIKAIGYYKIGMTKKPRQRMMSYRNLLPCDFDILAMKHFPNMAAEEKALLKRYENKKVRGEWFLFNDTDVEELMQYFKEV